jgi:hypothetical protein
MNGRSTKTGNVKYECVNLATLAWRLPQVLADVKRHPFAVTRLRPSSSFLLSKATVLRQSTGDDGGV